MNKKPISKIIRIGKIKEFAITDSQAMDPAFDLDLGDTVMITVVGKVTRSADAGENLFAFSREFAVDPDYAYLNNVKKWEEADKEKAEKEASDVDNLVVDEDAGLYQEAKKNSGSKP